MKRYRKSIRIGGRAVSKVFYSREAAERWYIDQKHRKIFSESGTPIAFDASVTLAAYFDFEWLPQRKCDYRKGTWAGEVQRFNAYVRPKLGHIALCQITLQQAREALVDVTAVHEKSIGTRNLVRALLSNIIKGAMNRPEPLLRTSPLQNLTFGRGGRNREEAHEPKILKNSEEIAAYIAAAKSLGPEHHAWAMLSLMTGMRASEVIALRWGSVNLKENFIHVREHYLARENVVHRGTKAGDHKTRAVPLFPALRRLLVERRGVHAFSDADYVLQRAGGRHWDMNTLADVCADVNRASGLSATPHGLRHSFAREYALRSGGDLHAIQAILGHASLKMTQHYSHLGIDRLKSWSEAFGQVFDTQNLTNKSADE